MATKVVLFTSPLPLKSTMAKLPMPAMLIAIVLHLILLPTLTHASRLWIPRARARESQSKRPSLPHAINWHPADRQRAVANGSACVENAPTKISAPKINVWKGLSSQEVKDITQWLYLQEDLNLTRFNNAGPLDNIIDGFVELMLPNKTDVLAYLDGDGPPPVRYAKTLVDLLQANGEFASQSILIGPLPVSRTKTTWQPLGYPYTRKSGKVRLPEQNEPLDWLGSLVTSIRNITKDLWPGLGPDDLEWDLYSMNSVHSRFARSNNN